MVKKVGIIGCGAVTEKMYLKTLPLIKQFKLSYLTDRDANRTARLAAISGAQAVELNTLKENSDVIIICTPPESHYDLTKSVLQPTKTVVCEKPFMTSYNNAVELVDKATQDNCTLLVAHFRRLFPSVVLARKMVNTLDLGTLQKISINEGGRFTWGAKSDYFFSSKYGGVTLDTGSHTIDMALYIAGLDNSDFSIDLKDVQKDKTEPSHKVSANFTLNNADQHVEVDLLLSRYEVMANQVVLTFTNGQLIIPSFAATYVLLKTNKGNVVTYAPEKQSSIMEAFFLQYKNIAGEIDEDIFNARRFLGLTKILETINNS